MNALADQVSIFSNSFKLNQDIHDLRVEVWLECQEPDAAFEYALAKPLLDLNSRRMYLLGGPFGKMVGQELC